MRQSILKKSLLVISSLSLVFSMYSSSSMLRLMADDEPGSSASGTEGGSTEGGSTEGGSTEGGSTEGGSTEGGSTEGGSTEGGSTEGGETTPEQSVTYDELTDSVIKKLQAGKTVSGIDSELKQKILNAVDEKKAISIEMTSPISIKENDVSNEDVTAIKGELKDDAKIAKYYDISLVVKIDGKEEAMLTELGGKKMTVSLPVPSVKLADGYKREYSVIRVHEKTADTIDAEVDGSSIVFETDKFSTYALAYTDIEKDASEKAVDNLIESLVYDEEFDGISEQLKADIKEAIADGKEITLEASTPTKIEAEDLKYGDAQLIKGVLTDELKIAKYYDVQLLVKADGETIGTVDSLNDKLTLELPLPTDLEKVADGYTRNFKVIRIHDEKATVLDAKVKDNKIVFETDKFSTYALAYEDVLGTATEDGTEATDTEKTADAEQATDTEKAGETSTTTGQKTTTAGAVDSELEKLLKDYSNESISNPKTGDSMEMYAIMLMLSGLMLTYGAAKVFKKKTV